MTWRPHACAALRKFLAFDGPAAFFITWVKLPVQMPCRFALRSSRVTFWSIIAASGAASGGRRRSAAPVHHLHHYARAVRLLRSSDGTELAVRGSCSGPPLLLVHGA